MNMPVGQAALADRWDGRESAQPKGRWERPRGSLPAAMDPVMEQLSYLRGPSTGLETQPAEPKKFTGRCRLFVGNLPGNFTEDQFRKLFEDYGEVAEIFLNTSKGFGFVKLVSFKNGGWLR